MITALWLLVACHKTAPNQSTGSFTWPEDATIEMQSSELVEPFWRLTQFQGAGAYGGFFARELRSNEVSFYKNSALALDLLHADEPIKIEGKSYERFGEPDVIWDATPGGLELIDQQQPVNGPLTVHVSQSYISGDMLLKKTLYYSEDPKHTTPRKPPVGCVIYRLKLVK